MLWGRCTCSRSRKLLLRTRMLLMLQVNHSKMRMFRSLGHRHHRMMLMAFSILYLIVSLYLRVFSILRRSYSVLSPRSQWMVFWRWNCDVGILVFTVARARMVYVFALRVGWAFDARTELVRTIARAMANVTFQVENAIAMSGGEEQDVMLKTNKMIFKVAQWRVESGRFSMSLVLEMILRRRGLSTTYIESQTVPILSCTHRLEKAGLRHLDMWFAISTLGKSGVLTMLSKSRYEMELSTEQPSASTTAPFMHARI
mmetsp:Transcript_119111/g.188635  ORF Transcript_119111/g.188635 Transcript_119111/m.188635 type:complete len:257 (+) Transcript_119111:446-1216(+)